MKKFKKAVSLFAALASAAVLLPSGMASAEAGLAAGETTLYYNDFPTGTAADLGKVEHEKYFFYGRNDDLKKALNVDKEYNHTTAANNTCYTYNMSLDPIQKSEWNGDTGVRIGSNCGLGAGPVVMLDFRYKDAEKTPTEDGALVDGMYKLEFDFVLDGDVNKTDGIRVEANCKHGNCGNSFAWIMHDKWHNLSGGNTWSYTEANIPITNDELHHYELVFDLDGNVVHTYMDGVKRKDTKFSGNINFLNLTMGGKIKFIDDIRFSELSSDIEVQMTEKTASEDGIVYELNDYALSAEKTKATITDVYTGSTINATVAVVGGSKCVTVTPATKLTAGKEYKVDFSGEAISTLRGSVDLESEVFNFATENALLKLTSNDFYGTKASFANKVPAELEGYTFEFTDDVNAKSALANLEVKVKNGDAVDFTIEEGENASTATIVFQPSLMGGTDYEMSLDGLAVDYDWAFKTEEGSVALKPIKLYKEDGTTPVELKDLAKGDKVKAVLTLVSTKALTEPYNAFVTAGLYSENSLDGFGFAEMTLTADKTSDTLTANFEVKDTTDLAVKGFVWNALETRTPIKAPIVVK